MTSSGSNPWKWLVLGCGGLVAAVVVAGLAFGAAVYGKIRAAAAFAEETRAAYAAINSANPFAAPAAGTLPAADRIDAFFSARDQLQRSLAQAGTEWTEKFRPGAGPLTLFRAADSAIASIRTISAAHLESLKNGRMSLDEYSWIQGWILNAVLAQPEGDARRDRYMKLIEETGRELQNARTSLEPGGALREYKPADLPGALAELHGKAAVPAEVLSKFTAPAKDLGWILDMLAADRGALEALRLMQRAPRPSAAAQGGTGRTGWAVAAAV